MCQIIPGILEKDWEKIEEKLKSLKSLTETVHIDVIDGKFANNLTFLDPTPFAKYKDEFLLEVHLMVEEPIDYLKPFFDAGFKRFLGHIEKMSDQTEFVAMGEIYGEIGLAIDGPTNLDELKVDLFDLDALLLMTIKAGFSGQSFKEEYLIKAKEIKKRLQNMPLGKEMIIEVDGGLDDWSIVKAKEAGANRFVSNSFLFKGDFLKQKKLLSSLI